MKLLMSSLVFLMVANAAQAKTKIVKECNAHIYLGEERSQNINMLTKVLSEDNGTLRAEITNTVDGKSTVSTEEVVVSEAPIRAGLTKNIDGYNNDLTDAELIIVHAMTVTTEPILKWSAGIDLSKVRSVKLFTLGETTRFGSATIVEAKDEKGEVLGSFLGGFVVSACK